jgi:hypothetical protein
MRAAPVAVNVQRRSVVRIVAARRQRPGAASQRDQDERKAGSKHGSDDHRKPDSRVRDRDRYDGGNHSQPADTLDLNVRHIYQRV